MAIEIRLADYSDAVDAAALIKLLNAYACDPMGGGEPLSPDVQKNLAEKLAEFSGAFSVLAWVDDKPAGLINCFMAFSTFKCQPIVNIHDVTVMPEFRGLGLSRLMLNKVEAIARARGCCKLTLEVLEGNARAQQFYQRFGFAGYQLDEDKGNALFWEMPLG